MRGNTTFPTTSSSARRRGTLVAFVLAALPLSAGATPLSLEDAIRSAWKTNLGIASSSSMVAAARGDAEAARAQMLPSLLVSAKALATNEPVAAFGLKLDQQRIAATDFDPARLNHPDAIGAAGIGVAVVQPLYLGGRLTGAGRATASQADAEDQQHRRRRQEIALHVAQTYFAAQVATEAIRYAEDVVAHARETEAFTKARNEQGLVLDADVARSTAFRAQAEAEQASARQGLASARAALALLTGAPATAELTTPLPADARSDVGSAPPAPSLTEVGRRPDVESARLRAQAAR